MKNLTEEFKKNWEKQELKYEQLGANKLLTGLAGDKVPKDCMESPIDN